MSREQNKRQLLTTLSLTEDNDYYTAVFVLIVNVITSSSSSSILVATLTNKHIVNVKKFIFKLNINF